MADEDATECRISLICSRNTFKRDEDATERAIFEASSSLFAPVTVTYKHSSMFKEDMKNKLTIIS